MKLLSKLSKYEYHSRALSDTLLFLVDFQGRVVNFNTAGFYQRYPEAVKCKDINQWWTEEGIWQI